MKRIDQKETTKQHVKRPKFDHKLQIQSAQINHTVFKETDQKSTKVCTDGQAPKHQITISHQNQRSCINKQRILLERKTQIT